MSKLNIFRGATPAVALLLGLAAFSMGQAHAATVCFAGTSGSASTTKMNDINKAEFGGTANLQSFGDFDCSGGCTFAFDANGGTGGNFTFSAGGSDVAAGTFDTLFSGRVVGTHTANIWVAQFNFTSGALGALNIIGGSALLTGTTNAPGLINFTSGTLTAVPLPAAAWLFGSALGLVGIMGGARQRAQRAKGAT